MSTMQLTDDQQNASAAFTDFLLNEDEKYMVIAGAAGTGKSTLMRHLVDTVQAKMRMFSLLLGKKREQGDFTIELTATTNKAAAVLSDLSGDTARTIHSRLGLVAKQDFKTGELDFIKGKNYEVIYNTLLVIDEASFISSKLFKDIDSSTVDCKILLVGDQYQLAPVKQAVPIMDSIDCTKVSLEKIMRHGGAIAKSGAKFRETVKTGVFTDITPNGVDIIHVDGPTFQRMIDDEFTHPDYKASKARILAWTNEKVQQYNAHIRSILGYDSQLGEGDVLTTNNPILAKNYTLANTDSFVRITDIISDNINQGISGRIVEINNMYEYFLPDSQYEVSQLLKQYAKASNWMQYYSIKNHWLDLRPVYASTVHKAQGSTYDTVFVNLSDIGKCNIWSDVARMMYVAITRAANKVVLYGQLPNKYRGL
jgi:exodeoxyribonuclease V